jgi:hypothetical protein
MKSMQGVGVEKDSLSSMAKSQQQQSFLAMPRQCLSKLSKANSMSETGFTPIDGYCDSNQNEP